MSAWPSLQNLVRRFPVLNEIWGRKPGRVPFVQQLSATECGPACLAMVLRYYGREVGVGELREIAVSGRDATNAEVLLETAKSYELLGRAVTLELDRLQYLETGSILHWQFNHFVVFERLHRGGMWILDPAIGRRWVNAEVVNASFTGVALLFTPSPSFVKVAGTGSRLRRYLAQIATERKFIVHVFATSFLLQVCGLILALTGRVVVDSVVPRRDYGLLWLLAIGSAGVLVFQAGTSIVRSQLMLYLRTRLDARMSVGFFDHLLALPFDFFQRRSAGDLFVRISSNGMVRDALTGALLSAFLDGSVAVVYLLVLFQLSPRMMGLALALGLFQTVILLLTRRAREELTLGSVEAQAKSQGYLIETLSAIEIVKSMGIEERAVQRWAALFARELNVSMRRGKLDAAIEGSAGLVRGASSAAVVCVGGFLVLDQKLSVGDMVAATALVSGFVGPVVSLASLGSRVQLLSVYLERLDDVLQAPVEKRDGVRPAGKLRGGVSVENVSFRYSPVSPLVLKNVSFQIGPGECVAIVGRSGSGKSTLARLVVGLYRPTDGKVSLDGVNLNEFDLSSVRRQIGIVTQQAQLFGGTIRSNIALADPDAHLEDVIQAAKMAQIHDFINGLPMGYDTVVLGGGRTLSGGEQQRIALARALFSGSRLVILDEATSNLDSVTEQAVQNALSELSCSRLVVAHRLSTVRRADRIVVLGAGEVLECGSHEELLISNGAYAALISSQTVSGGKPEASLRS